MKHVYDNQYEYFGLRKKFTVQYLKAVFDDEFLKERFFKWLKNYKELNKISLNIPWAKIISVSREKLQISLRYIKRQKEISD